MNQELPDTTEKEIEEAMPDTEIHLEWGYRGYTFTQHYEEGDPVHTPPSARRRAAAAAASIADQYGLVLFRPPRRNGREE